MSLLDFYSESQTSARLFKTLAGICLGVLIVLPVYGATPSKREVADDNIELKVDKLLAQMTQAEKIGQLALRDWGVYQVDEVEDVMAAVRAGHIGAFLNVNFSAVDPDAFEKLQTLAVNESRLGIPLLFGQDVIHGYKTIFPIPLGQAASWNRETVKQGARIAAQEASSDGIRWTFAPMIDIARDPRWGRIAESLGEDPYLAGELGAAMTLGFQTDDPSRPDAIAATAKHFAGYGAAEGGRDYNSAMIPEGELRDIYLPPFKASVDAGLMSIMSSYNTLNHIPATANKFLMKDILRDEWKFNGFVVSDWNSVVEMVNHGYSENGERAGLSAARAGIDIEMYTKTYQDHMSQWIAAGEFSEPQLDQAVRHILRVKFKLGLFETPFNPIRDKAFLNANYLAAARASARESMVLLRNQQALLPLRKNQKVALVGPMANAAHDQLGTWIYNADKKDSQTFYPALKQYLGHSAQLNYAPGLAFSRDQSTTGFSAAIAAAKKSDVIIFVGGEEAILSGEGHSRGDISLPGAQTALLAELAKLNKPIVLVLMAGRPVALGTNLDYADAILMAWHPGTMAGPALVDVLYGAYNPSGRLPLSWPVAAGQIPIHYNHLATGRPATDDNYTRMNDIGQELFQHVPGNSSNLLDYGHKPQFPFGFGLNYSAIEYSDLVIDGKQFGLQDTITAKVTITNRGKYDAEEVVQLYIRDHFASRVRPVRELKRFKKVSLAAGKSKTVTIQLPVSALAFHDVDMVYRVEPGDFTLWLAPNAEQGLAVDFAVLPK